MAYSEFEKKNDDTHTSNIYKILRIFREQGVPMCVDRERRYGKQKVGYE